MTFWTRISSIKSFIEQKLLFVAKTKQTGLRLVKTAAKQKEKRTARHIASDFKKIVSCVAAYRDLNRKWGIENGEWEFENGKMKKKIEENHKNWKW